MTKTQLTKNLREMDSELGNLVARLENGRAESAETLYCAEKKSYIEFYKSDGKTKTYLGKDRHGEIVILADKTYRDRLLGST